MMIKHLAIASRHRVKDPARYLTEIEKLGKTYNLFFLYILEDEKSKMCDLHYFLYQMKDKGIRKTKKFNRNDLWLMLSSNWNAKNTVEQDLLELAAEQMMDLILPETWRLLLC